MTTTEQKDFEFRCAQCGEEMKADTIKSARAEYVRHGKKHPFEHFPLQFKYSRWRGAQVSATGILNEDGSIR